MDFIFIFFIVGFYCDYEKKINTYYVYTFFGFGLLYYFLDYFLYCYYFLDCYFCYFLDYIVFIILYLI